MKAWSTEACLSMLRITNSAACRGLNHQPPDFHPVQYSNQFTPEKLLNNYKQDILTLWILSKSFARMCNDDSLSPLIGVVILVQMSLSTLDIQNILHCP